MDPNYFVLDYSRVLEILLAIVLFSMFLERALSVVFESEWFIRLGKWVEKVYGNLKYAHRVIKILATLFFIIISKEGLTLILAITLCIVCDFDVFTILLVSDETVTLLGEIITGALIAGGSKVSIKLFHDALKIMSSAEKKRRAEEIEKRKKENLPVLPGKTPYDN